MGWIRWLAGLALLGVASAWAADEPPTMAAAPAWVQDEPLPPSGNGSGGLRYELVSDQIDLTAPRPLWYHRVSYTVQRDSALAAAGQIGLYFQPDYQTVALNHLDVWRDGRRIDMRKRAHYARLRREDDLELGLLDGALTLNINLPDLRVGDRIDYGYTTTGANPVFGRGYHDLYAARYDVPLAARRVRVRYRRDLPLHWKVSAPGFQHARRQQGGVEELRLEADAVPAVRSEKDTPEGYDAYGRIELSTAGSWRDVADWAAALYPNGFHDAAAAAAIARQLKLERADPLGSMQRATAFVQGDIRYLGLEMGANSHAPHAPEETLRNRYGDCKDKATLLVALLALAGVPAEPVLVNSAIGMDLSARLPSPLAFDHVVVRARPPGAEFWIDATRDREYGPFDARGPLPFGQGLPVLAGQAALVAVPYPAPSVPDVAVAEGVQIATRSPRRQARFSVVTDYLRGLGGNVRDMFEAQGAEAVGDQYLDYMRRYYSALELEGPPSVDDRDPARLRVAEAYRLAWHRRDNDVVGFPLFQLQDWMKELPRTDRRTPLSLGGPRLATQTVRVRSDGGLWVRTHSETVENPWFRFSRRVAMERGELVIEGEWERRALAIPPEGMRRAARDMARARELLFFELDVGPRPWRRIGVAAWLYALAGIGTAVLLLLAALWSAFRGGIGQALFAPHTVGARLASSRALRWQAWGVFALSALLGACLARPLGVLAFLRELASILGQAALWALLFWGVLALMRVRIRAGRLATALAAGQAPQLPFVAGAVVATIGALGWMAQGTSPPPAAWPGLVVMCLLVLAAIVWTVVAIVGVVAAASGAPRWRVFVAWLILFCVGGVALLGVLAARLWANHLGAAA